MMPEPTSCAPRSQEASAEAASSSEPAGQDHGQWNAAMTREFKQPPTPEESIIAAPDVPEPSPQTRNEADPFHRSDEDW
eukprot:9499929-Prorocentrum_lima.AAC.1